MQRRNGGVFATFALVATLGALVFLPLGFLWAQDNEAETKTYRLVRVKIPPDSPHRKRADINVPPRSYVVILRNGEQIGKSSTSAIGWESEFPDKSRNRWDIAQDPSGSYTVQLWDSQWGSDVMIFSKAELTAAAFNAPVKEDLGKNYPEDNAVSVTFAELAGETPD